MKNTVGKREGEAVNTESGGLEEVHGTERKSWPHEARICLVCGSKYFASADGGFCPVCLLRAAAAGGN